jgi:phytoene/squalene synthetase
MDQHVEGSGELAAAITKAASKQTYFTIRLFADRGRAADAYRAYGYFRWVDDILDAETGSIPEKIAFANRQKSLLAACYRGETPDDLCAEEWMLVDLVHNDTTKNSGLHTYLHNMMEVMIFDARRRGQLITQAQLCHYSDHLAKAVTEAMYYFIGHDDPSPCHEARYLAVAAAHITHMLRDALEDVDNGYINIPSEYLSQHAISAQDVRNPAYQKWVCERVRLARRYFKLGRECTSQVNNLRCRLAGYAYMARFEWMLDTIEREGYCLRSEYPERKSLRACLRMGWSTLATMLSSLWLKTSPHKLTS